MLVCEASSCFWATVSAVVDLVAPCILDLGLNWSSPALCLLQERRSCVALCLKIAPSSERRIL